MSATTIVTGPHTQPAAAPPLVAPPAAPTFAAPRQQAAAPRVPPFPIYQFSVQQYHEMIQKGVLTEGDPVELLEGWIVPKMPRYPLHDGTVQRTNRTLARIVPQGWEVRVQSAITLADSEPEPDLAIVQSVATDYTDHHPFPNDIGLLVECAETSLDSNRTDKGRIYARAELPAYWIINLVDRQIEVYSDPDPRARPPAYRRRETYLLGQSVPLVLHGQPVAQILVQDLLP